MRILHYIFLMLLVSVVTLQAQLTPPCGSSFTSGVTVDSCSKVLRRPLGAPFFDANLDPYVCGLPLVVAEGTDVFYLLDGTDCLNPKKSTIQSIVDLAMGCVTICGTPCTLGMFNGTGDGMIDSKLRQAACNTLIYENGCNDATFSFASLTGPQTYSYADVTGFLAVDNGLTLNSLAKATATNGELVDSTIKDTGFGVGFRDACCFLTFQVNYGVGAVESYRSFQMKNRQQLQFFESTGNGSNSLGIRAPTCLAASTIYGLAHVNDDANASAFIVPVSLGNSVTLIADDTVVSISDTFQTIASDNACSALRTFTLGFCRMVEGAEYTLRWAGCCAGELLDTGVFKLSADWRPTGDDTLSGKREGINFYETGRSSN